LAHPQTEAGHRNQWHGLAGMCADRLEQVEQFVDGLLSDEALGRDDGHACPYLPGRAACSEGFCVDGPLDPAVYRVLMDRGFRRSGNVVYRPVCSGCRLCIAIRIPTATFTMTRSQRRVFRRNRDVRVTVGDGQPSDEKYELYHRYQTRHHNGAMACDFARFADFCYAAPLPMRELCYHVGDRLVGVSLLDEVPGALSSMYMYFEPAESRRSLGTYSVLREIADCRSAGIEFYYLGFYVPGSRTMDYKARYQPAELLTEPGVWLPYVQAVTRLGLQAEICPPSA